MALLEHYPDILIGREPDRQRIRERLDQGARWITLTGTAGVGKTRLAVEAGLERTRALRDTAAVQICGLASARTRSDVERMVTFALGTDDVLGTLATLDGVLLDACEGLDETARELLQEWAEATPTTWFLATSRQALEVAGEAVQLVEPLASDEAATLFLSRAPRRRADRGDLRERWDDILGLAEVLGGIPLAIELAAGRLEVLHLSALQARMDSPTPLLRDPDAPPDSRHRSLQAALETSWQALDPLEREVLHVASAFEGGVPLDALEHIVIASERDGVVLDAVQGLIRKSLMRIAPEQIDPNQTRYRMYASVRHYVCARHEEHGTDPGTRLREWYAERIPAWIGAVGGGPDRLRLRAEHENLYMIVRNFLSEPSPDGLETALRARSALYLGSWSQHGSAWMLGLIDALSTHVQPDTPPSRWIVDLLLDQSAMYRLSLRFDRAIAAATRALDVAERMGSPGIQARAQSTLGMAYDTSGDRARARVAFERQLELAREAGKMAQVAAALYFLAATLDPTDRPGLIAKKDRLTEAIHALERDDRPVWMVLVRIVSAQVALDLSEPEDAEADIAVALRTAARLKRPFEEAHARLTRAAISVDRGDLEAARTDVEQAGAAAESLAVPDLTFEVALQGGLVELTLGDVHAAAERLDACASSLSTATSHRDLYAQWSIARALAALGADDDPSPWLEAARGVGTQARHHAEIDDLTRAIEDHHAALSRLATTHEPVDAPRGVDASKRALCWARGRIFWRVLDALHQQLEGRLGGWRIARTGAWFTDPSNQHVSLARRKTLVPIVAALVEARDHRPGEVVSRATLIETAWPGQVMVKQSARNRLNVAISSLRKSGLTLIESGPDGYRLDPAVLVLPID